MNMTASAAAVGGGFIALAAGAELLVRGGAGAARTLGVSTLVIGMTVVAYGTSAPELIASFVAGLYGHPDVTIGNVIGSNIANIGLILGATALASPFKVRTSMISRELRFMVLVTVLFYALAFRGEFGRVVGVTFLLSLVLYNILSLRWAKREPPVLREEAADLTWEEESKKGRPLGRDILIAVTGLTLLLAGGHFLVLGAVSIAERAGMSETVVGVTLVAIGTSLPELATSLVAALRGELAISLGNMVGSNLFNVLGAIGICSTVRPFEVKASLLRFEFPLLLAFTVVMAVLLGRGRRVGRFEGALLLGGYAAFLAAILYRSVP